MQRLCGHNRTETGPQKLTSAWRETFWPARNEAIITIWLSNSDNANAMEK
uniref:Uncharacterized protein n=1 Tax=Anguilla anguilla TaxID=7936 RepID=A0A0E9RX08_ANGAN